MTDRSDVVGCKCFDKSAGPYYNIELESCIIGTVAVCELQDSETGKQDVTLENAKRHVADAEISLLSQNQAVEFSTDSSSFANRCKLNQRIPPATVGNPGRVPIELDIRQADGSVVMEETLTVEVSHEYRRSGRNTTTKTEVHPRVDLD